MKARAKSIKKLIGKTIYVVNKNRVTISGKLVSVSNNKLYVQPNQIGNKTVRTNAIIPLVLFDLLAVGTSPYAGYGGYGYGYPGYGGYGYLGYGSYGYGGYGYGGYGYGGYGYPGYGGYGYGR